MAASVEIRLKRVNKIYHDGDTIAGLVVIQSKGELTHNGITLTIDGNVSLQLSAKSVGMFEAFYNSLKPIQLISYSLELAKGPGKLPSGKTEIPFEMPLKSKPGKPALYETYHGVFVSIQYSMKVDIKRNLLNKDLQKSLEFVVENKAGEGEKAKKKRIDILMNPGSLQNVKERQHVPQFELKGHIDSTSCCITQPFTGERNKKRVHKGHESLTCDRNLQLRVVRTEVPIKSIELQLIRVETCGCAEGYAKDATEIQNIQIVEGDVSHGLAIPVYMIFPRLFTCPTLATNNFKIEFEVNIVVVFKDDHLVSENFPIILTRH